MHSRLVVNSTLYPVYYSGGQQYNVPREVSILLWSCTVHCTRIVVRVTWYIVVDVCESHVRCRQAGRPRHEVWARRGCDKLEMEGRLNTSNDNMDKRNRLG